MNLSGDKVRTAGCKIINKQNIVKLNDGNNRKLRGTLETIKIKITNNT